MDIDFAEEKNKFMVIYFDQIIVYFYSNEEHVKHLQRVFMKCKIFGISLNPKKSIFSMKEGRLLGHVISKEGINIDPTRFQAIQQIEIPRIKKEVQSFIGKVNFLRRFIPNFVEILNLMTSMLKKESEIKWTVESRQTFEKMKKALSKAPILVSPHFSKDFMCFFLPHNTLLLGYCCKKMTKT